MKSMDMPSTSCEIKEEVQSDDEMPLRRHSSRVCKSTYRFQDNNDESEDDDPPIKPQRSKRLVKPPPKDDDYDSDDEFVPTKSSYSRRLPVCEERFALPSITSRRRASRFHNDDDEEDEEQPTRARSTRSLFLNTEENDQRGTRNLRKKKRWNYAKMLNVSGLSSEEGGADDWKPTNLISKRAARHKNKTKQTKNYNECSDQSFNDSSDGGNDDDNDGVGDDDGDDDDEENSVSVSVSVSSRGRIRKLTAEAKAHLFRR